MHRRIPGGRGSEIYQFIREFHETKQAVFHGDRSKSLATMVEGFKITSQIIFIYFISGCAGSSLLCRLFFSCSEQGLLFIAMASLVVEHGL